MAQERRGRSLLCTALRHLYITSFALVAPTVPKRVNLYRIESRWLFSRRKTAVREGTQAYTQVRYYNGVLVPHLTLIRVLGPNEF